MTTEGRAKPALHSQRRTEVWGSLGHWRWGAQIFQQRYPVLQELRNKTEGFFFFVNLLLLTLFLLLILLLSLVHLLGSISLFKLFFPAPFESFQSFLNPDPRPFFVKHFLFLPHYRCYLFFTIALQAVPSFPPVFLVYLHIPACFFSFWKEKKCRGSCEVLHKIKGTFSLIVFHHCFPIQELASSLHT